LRGPETLKTIADFQRVFATDFRFFRDGLGFYVRSSLAGGGFRFGIAAPKRFGHAVERNKVRRRLREVIRLSSELPKGIDVVICIGKPCRELGFGVVQKTLHWAWGRIRRTLPYKSGISGE